MQLCACVGLCGGRRPNREARSEPLHLLKNTLIWDPTLKQPCGLQTRIREARDCLESRGPAGRAGGDLSPLRAPRCAGPIQTGPIFGPCTPPPTHLRVETPGNKVSRGRRAMGRLCRCPQCLSVKTASHTCSAPGAPWQAVYLGSQVRD